MGRIDLYSGLYGELCEIEKKRPKQYKRIMETLEQSRMPIPVELTYNFEEKQSDVTKRLVKESRR